MNVVSSDHITEEVIKVSEIEAISRESTIEADSRESTIEENSLIKVIDEDDSDLNEEQKKQRLKIVQDFIKKENRLAEKGETSKLDTSMYTIKLAS